METELVKIIGFLAAILSTTSFLPQLYKTWKSRSANNLSLPMLLLYNIAGVCWLTYGLFIDSLPIIGCNLISTLAGIVLICLKFSYQKNYL